jgi:Mg-chelatase subunit ChlD
MNDWSRRRKRIILSLIFLAIVILVGVPSFFLFYRAPSCSDGTQNGDETGVDCGGSCQLLCKVESLPLILKGDPQVLKVRANTYEVVVLVDNPNAGADIYRAGYTFKIYDATSLTPLKIVEGEAYVPKGETFAVFEGPFEFASGVVPTRATFEWKQDSLVWQKNNQEPVDVTFGNVSLRGESTRPRIDATLVNNSINSISNVDLVVIVSGGVGNFIAASKTFLEGVSGGESIPITFTWPNPFDIRESVCGYPVDVALVIDRSGSMDDLSPNPPQPLTDVKNTALYFLNQLGKNDHYSLVSFANEASQPIDAGLGADINSTKNAVNNISIKTDVVQNTNIGAGIFAARDELNSVRHREKADKALVLLTDGVPTIPLKSGVKDYPKTYAIEAAQSARESGISVYTIGLGKDVDIDLLRKLATSTEEAYFAPTTKELNSIYNQIATKICRESAAVVDIYVRLFPDRSFIR